MIGVLEGFAVIFTVIFVGYLLARLNIIASDEQRLTLNRIAFFAATPALVFQVVSTAPTDSFFSTVSLVSIVTALASAALFLALAYAYTRYKNTSQVDGATLTMGAAASGYVNSNNIGLPVGIYVLGSTAYVPPLLLVQMLIFTPIILALITRNNQNTRVWQQLLHSLKNSLLSPVVLAAFSGLVVSICSLHVPELVLEPLSILGGASIPVILLSFGASLHKASVLAPESLRALTILATTIKVLLMPVLALCFGSLFHLHSDQLYAVVILAALPTAQNVYNYAATYQRGQTITRDTILLSTFLSLPVMFCIALLFGR
ncbi:AEC family transporter [Corynebacterium sp. sy017]|uniref:AEC family transporter n=1 Tax=unclassified Corynebacterium TaxID=2624378 RepID=UPI0011870D1F|nr:MULTISPECIES: AEC family transporter [unclassified Corynebacterium]MBP3088101.1 AEC family transporter [Corynebacterium sp. sy017]TSD92624.1 AEC family transporter [Corynebacterium sp. SY003]